MLVDGDSPLDADSINGGAGFDTFDFRGWVTLPHLRLDLAAGLLQAGNAPGVWLTIAQLAPGSMENAIGSAFGDLMISDGDGNVFQGLEGADSLLGGTGADSLSGGDGDDSLIGGDGADTLAPGAGADTLEGGGGTDWVSYADATQGVEVVLADSRTTTGRGAAGDTMFDVENVQGSAFDDLLSGVDTRANWLRGGAGADSLSGARDDTLEGGNGADAYTVFDTGMPLVLDGGIDGARDLLIVNSRPLATVVLPDSIENLRLQTESSAASGPGTTGIGNLLDNWLTGGHLNDILIGQNADDTLQGAGGNDVMIGGPGADLYLVEDPGDVVVAEGDLADTVQAAVSYSLVGTGAQRLVLAPGATGITGSGGAGDDTLDGNGHANRLLGQDGNDVLRSGEGADTLLGGHGNDSMQADAGADLVLGQTGDDTARGQDGNDTLMGGAGQDSLMGDSGADLLVGGDGGDELLGGLDQDTLSGGAGNDTLNGGDGADVLRGGAGDDSLHGMEGADRLRGDDGADAFALGKGSFAGKRVLDFDALEGDWLQLRHLGPGLPPGPLAEARFVANLSGKATQDFAQVIYETDAGRLWYDPDGTGAVEREVLAILVGAPTLSASDIVIF